MVFSIHRLDQTLSGLRGKKTCSVTVVLMVRDGRLSNTTMIQMLESESSGAFEA